MDSFAIPLVLKYLRYLEKNNTNPLLLTKEVRSLGL